jgi:hypothetical protein
VRVQRLGALCYNPLPDGEARGTDENDVQRALIALRGFVRQRATRRAGLVLFGIVMGGLYWSPAFWAYDDTGHGDWQHFQHQWESGYVAFARYGEIALWNPYHCGGVFVFDDPQAQIYSPLFWLLFPFGTTLGLKLFLFVHAAIGFAGMYYYARRALDVQPVAAFAAAIVWAGSGYFAWHGSGGHSAFLPFYFTPWLLLAWQRAATDVRFTAVVAAILGFSLLEGAVYPFPFFCLLLAFDAAVRLVGGPNRLGILRAGLVTAPLALLACGFRLLPIMHTLSSYPREGLVDDFLTPSELLDMLVLRENEYYSVNHEYVWAEYGTFIGWGAVGLGALGAIVALRKHPGIAIGALLFGLLTLGSFAPHAPWTLLQELPVFGSLRVPSRWAVFFVFYWALLAATLLDSMRVALGRLRGAWRFVRKPAVVALAMIPLALAVDIGWGNAKTIDRWRRAPLPRVVEDGTYHLRPWDEYRRYAAFPALDVSNPGCYSGMTYRAAPGLWTGETEQVRFEGRSGVLESFSHTNNTIQARVSVPLGSTAVFNQTWAEGWQTSVGTLGKNARGLITVSLPPGTHDVRLRYVPTTLKPALACLLLAIWALVAVATIPRRRPAWLERRAKAQR